MSRSSSSSTRNSLRYAVGESYMITTRNGAIQGEIIEKRASKEVRDKQKDGATISVTQLRHSECEYYIHFPSLDRRMDEWVAFDRIGEQSTDSGESGAHGHSHGNEQTDSFGKKKRRIDSKEALSTLAAASSSSISAAGASAADKKGDAEKNAQIAQLEKENEDMTKVKNIERITIGKYEVDAWYYSPYPEEYTGGDMLYICEYCLKYAKSRESMTKHSAQCKCLVPPGKEIYREDTVSMWEVDGSDHKIYCQNLCLLSKLFLDHKTLYYDVDPFLFYVLCEVDEFGSHIVGYFSKERVSADNNLACILTFPQYQRKGYGKLLISISYELTKLEGTTGSPEKPLSDLGKISYRSYWAYVIGKCFENDQDITMADIQATTGIKYDDVLSTLHSMNLLKSWKGQYVISIKQVFLDQQKLQARRIRLCDPKLLRWEPNNEKSDKPKGNARDK